MIYRHPFTLCGFRFEAKANGYPDAATNQLAAESLANKLAQTVTEPREAAQLFSTLWDCENGFATSEAAALEPVRREMGQLLCLLCERDPDNESGRLGISACAMLVQ